METCWIKMCNFIQSKSKFGNAYILTPKGLGAKARLTRFFLRRKMQEYESLKAGIERLKAEVGSETDIVQRWT
jgi:hypothetical protein